MEVIVLAGGLGTRLQGVIGEAPKCMAPVNGKPFLAYIFEYLTRQKCVRAILSLGYKHQVVLDWLAHQDPPFVVDTVIEHEPLGTGGGIRLAMEQAVADNVVVLNGDTMFDVPLSEMMADHLAHHAGTTLALKKMYQFDRYGVVNIGATGVVVSFEEKKFREEGLINGGVYIIDQRFLHAKHLPHKFSFEKDYLEEFADEHKFYGHISDGYFIDIGIPEDYERAQTDFKNIFG